MTGPDRLTDAPAALDAMRAERDAEIERSDDLCGQVSTALVERNAMRAERDEASGVAMALSAQVDDLTRQLANVRRRIDRGECDHLGEPVSDGDWEEMCADD